MIGSDLGAEHRREIEALISRFNRAADSGSAEDVVATFTPDGEFEGPGGTHRGHDAIRAYNLKLQASSSSSRSRSARHLTSNTLIEFTGDASAVVRSDLYMIAPGEVSPEITMMGGYTDTVVLTSEGWRFRRRQVTVIQIRAPRPAPAVDHNERTTARDA